MGSEQDRRLVCLGWGSLIWDPKLMPIDSDWSPDGPQLPIEFARTSENGRLTLVVCEEGLPVPALWSCLATEELEQARLALSKREGTPCKNIGWIGGRGRSAHPCAESVALWASCRSFESVVWTALRPKFKGEYRVPTSAEVVQYLDGLEGSQRILAETYIRKAPHQIQTRYRSEIERALGWRAES